MEYKIAVQTDVGIKKETNQDSCCIKEAVTDKGTVLMAVICDGMGGLAKGEVASATLIKTFSSWFETELSEILATSKPLDEVEYRWDRIIKEQNQNIAAYGKNLKLQLGSTITAMLILEDNRYIIVHVGDSRAYKITDTNVKTLTEDQTVVAKEVRQGRLTPKQAEADPRRNVLLQCVGASRIVEPEFYYGSVTSDECYMLCSDGFRHVITSEEILNAFAPSQNSTEEQMNAHIVELIELNKFRHENDNITALLIKTVKGGVSYGKCRTSY